MNKSFNTRNRTFTTSKGNDVVVFCTKEVGSNVTGFRGLGKIVRTFAVVCGQEVEIAASFLAERAVRDAGF